MNLLPLFEWFEATWIGDTVRQSAWLFPVIEAVHLLALAVMGGAILLIDLRLLGVGLGTQPAAQLLREARPWMRGALMVMLATGVALFTSEAIKCYYNTSFWVKMTTLPVAMAFTFGVRDRVARTADVLTTMTTRSVAIVSIVLWFIVAAAGRWIGFSG